MFSHEKTVREIFISLNPGFKPKYTIRSYLKNEVEKKIKEEKKKTNRNHLGLLPVEKGNEKARWNISMK